MKTSLITTFYNEADSIDAFLESVLHQSMLPDEVVLVDGGSTDSTISKIEKFVKKHKKKLEVKFLIKEGNRSVGRNEAIQNASHEIILSTDVGCELDKEWVKEISLPFINKNVDVVAGYYRAKATTFFQKCLAPYALVMPDKVNSETFLPATRSMAFTKKVWKKVGKFDERYSHNEDYVFAHQLRKATKIVFNEKAIAYWIPRKTFKEAFIMFYRFALGDIEAGIYRPKVILLFIRYLFAFELFFLLFIFRSTNFGIVFFTVIFCYLVWSVKKNFRYVNAFPALYLLPLIQFTSDAAVILGSLYGVLKYIKFWLISLIKYEKGIIALVLFYIFILVGLIQWGIPNEDHPFLYHMDEWHQIAALKSVVDNGTTTIEGAAKMPLVHPLTSLIFVTPFVLFKIVNPYAIGSPFDTQELGRVFIALRLHTLFMGLLAIGFLYKISKDFFKANPFYVLYFFIISPIFISLSNYYKYDITLCAFLLLAVWMMLRYIRIPTSINYILAAFTSGLALATKFSVLPVIPLLLFIFFWHGVPSKKSLLTLLAGMATFVLTFLLFGIPDLFFVKSNYQEYLYSNLVTGPGVDRSFLVHLPPLVYFTIYQFPFLFGYSAAVLLILSLGRYLSKLKTSLSKSVEMIGKYELFIIVALFLFSISLNTLKFGGTGNRALVLLPFVSVLAGLMISRILQLKRKILTIFVIILFSAQFIQTISWISLKIFPDPRVSASVWMQKNIPKGTEVGLENIPIYQNVPDIALKEFYMTMYGKSIQSQFRYKAIDTKTKDLPLTIILTDPDFDTTYRDNTPKKTIVARVEREGYKKIALFSPNALFGNPFQNRREFPIANLGAVAPIPLIVIYHKN